MEVETNPAGEVEPEGSQEAAAEETEGQADNEPQDGDPEGNEPQDDSEEIEEEGERYKLPKKLADKYKGYKSGAMMQSDYTRKTQSLAEAKRQFEAEQAAAKANLDDHVQRKVITNRLDMLSKVDFQQAMAENYENAILLLAEQQQLQFQKTELDGKIQRYQDEQTLKTQQETAKQLQQGQAVLQREIKGWGAEYAQKLVDFGEKTYGIPKEELARVTDPKIVLALNDAFRYRQLIQKQAEKKPTPVAQPVATIKPKANSKPRGLSDELSTEEWMKRRNEQLRRNS